MADRPSIGLQFACQYGCLGFANYNFIFLSFMQIAVHLFVVFFRTCWSLLPSELQMFVYFFTLKFHSHHVDAACE